MKTTRNNILTRLNAATLFISLCALLVAILTGLSSSASAQEIQITGPLAGAPACKECRLYREGRFQIKPMVGFTLQDEFSRAIMFGGQLQYNITEWIGVGVWGGFAPVQINTGLTTRAQTAADPSPQNRLSLPGKENFDKQIGRFQWAAALQATFVPLRGKLALFEKVFVDSDFYVFGGVAVVGVEERAPINDPQDPATGTGLCSSAGLTSDQACLDTQLAREGRVALAPTLGVGLSLYATNYLSINLEWRALPFAWNTSGTDESGLNRDGTVGDGGFPDNTLNDDDQIFHLNHMFTVGASFFLPTAPGKSK